MSENKKKAKTATSDNYIETKRDGAIGANIFRRQAPGGFQYYDFNLSRAWKASSSNKEGYSQNYFANNREALHKAIDEACDRIQELESAGQETQPESSQTIKAKQLQPTNGVQTTAA
jgi:hypothetical protein